VIFFIRVLTLIVYIVDGFYLFSADFILLTFNIFSFKAMCILCVRRS